MRLTTYVLIAVLLAMVNLSGCISEAAAGWGGGACGPVGPAGYEWKTAHDGWLFLYRDGVLVAGYQPERDQFHRWDGASWGLAETPPWTQNDSDSHTHQGENFGLDLKELLGLKADRYQINGLNVTSKQARDAVNAPKLADDANKLRLTVIGPDTDRKAVLHDWATHPLFDTVREHFLVQDYPPDHWAVRAGFVTTGKPTIYVQRPDGAVLHRQDAYAGPEDLAAAIRKADPDYAPVKDPDLRKTTLDLTAIPPLGWLGGGLALLMLLWRKKATP